MYTVKRNYCDCHPETCCCDKWLILKPDGSKHSAQYSKELAVEISNALNNMK